MQGVSFIIPHKDDPLIDRLLDSLSKQTNRNFEVIIADASSNRMLSEVVKKWDGTMNIRIIHSKGGRGTARNIGAALAKEEVLTFVDADVVLPSNFAKVVIRLFDATPGLVAVGFPIYPTRVNKMSHFVYRTLRFLDEFSYHYRKPRIPTTCAAYRRSIFRLRFFTDLIGEDVLFSANIMKYGKALFAKSIKAYEEPRRWESSTRVFHSLRHYFPSYVINLLIVFGLNNLLLPKQEFKSVRN